MELVEWNLLLLCLEKKLWEKLFIACYLNIKVVTQIHTGDDIDIKIKAKNQHHIWTEFRKQIAWTSAAKEWLGETTNENNKLRNLPVLCDDSISCTPNYIQAKMPWIFEKWWINKILGLEWP